MKSNLWDFGSVVVGMLFLSMLVLALCASVLTVVVVGILHVVGVL